MVDPGVAHGIYNDPQRELRLRCQLTPALGIERYFAAVFALAAAGQVNRKGLPSPLRLASIAIEHAPGTYQAGIPVALQRAGLAVAATLGRRLP